MKFFFDLFPVIIFFVAYKAADIYVATASAIVASLVQVGYFWLRHRRFERSHLIALGLIVVFGGLTLILRDPTFIMWKPTVLYWVFAGVFLGSQFLGRTLTERMLSHAIQLPERMWRRLNLAWTLFFALMGVLNLYVAFSYSEETWVNFKLFGFTGLTFAFVFGQILLVSRHAIEPDQNGA